MLRALPLVLAAALLAACGDAETTAGDSATSVRATDVAGRRFLVTDVRGHALVAGSEVTLEFEAKRLQAYAGCNRLSGAWSVEDGRLQTHGDLAQTEMACEEPLMRQDEWLRSFLSGAPRIALDGERLTLSDDDVTIVLTEAAPKDPLPIVGTRWQLTSIGGRDGSVASVPGDPHPTTLLIEENGDVILFVGCGRGAGRAEVRDGFIDFRLVVLTAGCDRAAGRVAAAVEALLDGRVTVAAGFDGAGNLVLARDGRHLVFAPVR